MKPAPAENEVSIAQLIAEIVAFRDERDWKQFHTIRNLAAALSVEAAELMELTLWESEEEVESAIRQDPTDLQRECADVLIFALLICESMGFSPTNAIRTKLAENRTKYPVHLAKGRSTKYTHLAGELQGLGKTDP